MTGLFWIRRWLTLRIWLMFSAAICFTPIAFANNNHLQPHSRHTCAQLLNNEIKNSQAKLAFDHLKEVVYKPDYKINKKVRKSLKSLLPQLFEQLSRLPIQLSNASNKGLSEIFLPWFTAITDLRSKESEILSSGNEQAYFDLVTFHIKFLNAYLQKESISASQKAVIVDQIKSLNKHTDSPIAVYIYEFQTTINKYYDYHEAINCK